MKKVRLNIFIFLLLLASVMLGYNYFNRPFELSQEEIQSQKLGDESENTNIKKTKIDIYDELTAQEKILQMIAFPVVVNDEDIQAVNQDDAISSGFYTLFGENISLKQAKSVISSLKENKTSDLAPWIAVDHEGGEVQRLSGTGFTKVASWRDVCELDSQERSAVLIQTAYELQRAGINVVLAPVLDVGNNKSLGNRICSKDSYPVVADRSMDYVTAFLKVGILPVLKHFPGIGLAQKDLHESFDFISVLENDVKLYKYVIDQNEKIGVMTSHVGVLSQDKDIPCSVSPFCVSELNEAYPKVLVFTDALEMKSAAYDIENPKVPKDLVTVSKQAVLAGNDVLIYGPSVTANELKEISKQLLLEYENNQDFKTSVDQSVLKIIEYKYEDK